ncbi:orotidine-5'-phosphate decarboxylase [Legionella pneumophila]|uniref:Orotidine 5'-phosphate decarboxylase n=1 Tax=Legionella pneumophila subsp. pascullei TaxID=91890 RepID=A0AAX2IVU0_LEGPN|nr:orotidine-5'-phosphate decarboxylase [Legionella pneumophila]AMP89926.1 orotidine 5'-phosphate decarboxylase [Legionella pneumophila subsp. pascullei]AMP92407.1 orotidine 5'-phosphate decarboxylase [Legionella pneumophila subsp. pascullei]AMP95373.1 orotidine 5'-phosphate decarboxylase [Legionella pneumophila subsp. pascullei]SQG90269.1 orotidine-5'-phosphate decarboxylase [Legionella pneumophila subsp. pascullei]VEH06373.1 orotidine-5'-phosphate decarboxylase [Legionella pneumophila subsp.
MTPKLIVALDFDNHDNALQLVDKLDPSHCALKVGSELFTLLGPQFVKELVRREFKVFLDLKFHDIPNTVAKACHSAAELGVWMINVHAIGGLKMLQAAKESLKTYGQDKPLLIAVTVLTSFEEAELASVGISNSLPEQATHLAMLAREAGLDGVVSSAHEVKIIKQKCGENFITVTPGIRLPNNLKDDQSRVMTPQQAIREGSDFLVIGRPITQASNPYEVVSAILRDL